MKGVKGTPKVVHVFLAKMNRKIDFCCVYAWLRQTSFNDQTAQTGNSCPNLNSAYM